MPWEIGVSLDFNIKVNAKTISYLYTSYLWSPSILFVVVANISNSYLYSRKYCLYLFLFQEILPLSIYILGNIASILVLTNKEIDLKPSFVNILICLVSREGVLSGFGRNMTKRNITKQCKQKIFKQSCELKYTS